MISEKQEQLKYDDILDIEKDEKTLSEIRCKGFYS